ncbi:hypothetical protein OAG71_04860, partial [bacterium]|nr:hypothetical protein [bacterium]
DVGGLLSSRQILSPSGTSPEEDFYDKTQPYQTIKLYVLQAQRKIRPLNYSQIVKLDGLLGAAEFESLDDFRYSRLSLPVLIKACSAID